MAIPFLKMQSSGNDFVILDRCTNQINPNTITVETWANRHTGIGFDQLLILNPPQEPKIDFDLQIFNSDGSPAEQCGNGTACVAKYVTESLVAVKAANTFQTLGGVVHTECTTDANGQVDTVRVGVGVPTFEPDQIPISCSESKSEHTLSIAGGQTIAVLPVGLGNPHVVTFVDNVAETDVETIGMAIQKNKLLPNSANVEFVQIIDDTHIRARIFERGAGETLGCGSGVCAAVVAGRIRSKLAKKVAVEQPGGEVYVSWEDVDEPVYLTCQPQMVYQGMI